MQEKILENLCSPIDKKELKLIVFKNHKKNYLAGEIEECYEGVLIDDESWMFPVVNGVPRMQLDAFLEYGSLLKANYNEYDKKKSVLLDSYSQAVKDAIKKTK